MTRRLAGSLRRYEGERTGPGEDHPWPMAVNTIADPAKIEGLKRRAASGKTVSLPGLPKHPQLPGMHVPIGHGIAFADPEGRHHVVGYVMPVHGGPGEWKEGDPVHLKLELPGQGEWKYDRQHYEEAWRGDDHRGIDPRDIKWKARLDKLLGAKYFSTPHLLPNMTNEERVNHLADSFSIGNDDADHRNSMIHSIIRELSDKHGDTSFPVLSMIGSHLPNSQTSDFETRRVMMRLLGGIAKGLIRQHLLDPASNHSSFLRSVSEKIQDTWMKDRFLINNAISGLIRDYPDYPFIEASRLIPNFWRVAGSSASILKPIQHNRKLNAGDLNNMHEYNWMPEGEWQSGIRRAIRQGKMKDALDGLYSTDPYEVESPYSVPLHEFPLKLRRIVVSQLRRNLAHLIAYHPDDNIMQSDQKMQAAMPKVDRFLRLIDKHRGGEPLFTPEVMSLDPLNYDDYRQHEVKKMRRQSKQKPKRYARVPESELHHDFVFGGRLFPVSSFSGTNPPVDLAGKNPENFSSHLNLNIRNHETGQNEPHIFVGGHAYAVGKHLQEIAAGRGRSAELAESILRNGDHNSLPILADALEEEGHPLASGSDQYENKVNWRHANRGIAIDKHLVDFADYNQEHRLGVSGLDLIDYNQDHQDYRNQLLDYVRQRIPDATIREIRQGLSRQRYGIVRQGRVARLFAHNDPENVQNPRGHYRLLKDFVDETQGGFYTTTDDLGDNHEVKMYARKRKVVPAAMPTFEVAPPGVNQTIFDTNPEVRSFLKRNGPPKTEFHSDFISNVHHQGPDAWRHWLGEGRTWGAADQHYEEELAKNQIPQQVIDPKRFDQLTRATHSPTGGISIPLTARVSKIGKIIHFIREGATGQAPGRLVGFTAPATGEVRDWKPGDPAVILFRSANQEASNPLMTAYSRAFSVGPQSGTVRPGELGNPGDHAAYLGAHDSMLGFYGASLGHPIDENAIIMSPQRSKIIEGHRNRTSNLYYDSVSLRLKSHLAAEYFRAVKTIGEIIAGISEKKDSASLAAYNSSLGVYTSHALLARKLHQIHSQIGGSSPSRIRKAFADSIWDIVRHPSFLTGVNSGSSSFAKAVGYLIQRTAASYGSPRNYNFVDRMFGDSRNAPDYSEIMSILTPGEKAQILDPEFLDKHILNAAKVFDESPESEKRSDHPEDRVVEGFRRIADALVATDRSPFISTHENAKVLSRMIKKNPKAVLKHVRDLLYNHVRRLLASSIAAKRIARPLSLAPVLTSTAPMSLDQLHHVFESAIADEADPWLAEQIGKDNVPVTHPFLDSTSYPSNASIAVDGDVLAGRNSENDPGSKEFFEKIRALQRDTDHADKLYSRRNRELVRLANGAAAVAASAVTASAVAMRSASRVRLGRGSGKRKKAVAVKFSRESFEAAIHQEPHEASNHLVYADWLDESGHPEEAEHHRLLGSIKQNVHKDWWGDKHKHSSELVDRLLSIAADPRHARSTSTMIAKRFLKFDPQSITSGMGRWLHDRLAQDGRDEDAESFDWGNQIFNGDHFPAYKRKGGTGIHPTEVARIADILHRKGEFFHGGDPLRHAYEWDFNDFDADGVDDWTDQGFFDPDEAAAQRTLDELGTQFRDLNDE